MKKYTYNNTDYDFRGKIQSLYDLPLEELHQQLDVFDAHTDQSSDFHRRYYDGISGTDFYEGL